MVGRNMCDVPEKSFEEYAAEAQKEINIARQLEDYSLVMKHLDKANIFLETMKQILSLEQMRLELKRVSAEIGDHEKMLENLENIDNHEKENNKQ